MSDFTRYVSPVRGPQGLAWDGSTMWITSAADGHVYDVDIAASTVRREFVPPSEALGITFTGSDFRLVLAPEIDEPDLERDRRYVFAFSPERGFRECFLCPDASGSFVAWADETLYVSQAWDKKIVALDERGACARVVQLDRRPVGMTIVDGAFYLVTVDDEWVDGRFERLAVGEPASSIHTLHSLEFKPRSVAFDGERFWIADRNGHGLVSVARTAFD